MTKVSIIITNYNYGKYLMKAIKSALDQDYPQEDLEIILIDDASTNKATRKLVESYEHSRVKKILLKENVGVVRARNMAIEVAGGGYILPLDADDYFARDYVRLAAQILDAQPHVGMVYPLGEYIGYKKGPWLKCKNIRELILEEGVPSCSMYRKSIWQAVGGYHDYMYYGSEDWDFTLCVLKQGWQLVCLEDSVGVYYRIKDGSRSAKAQEHKYELAAHIYHHHRDLFQQYDLIQTVFRESYLYRKYIHSDEYRVGYAIVGPVKNIVIALCKMLYNLKKIFNPE